MRDEVRIDLETQLEEARAAWQQAEQTGAELAQHALQSDGELKSLRQFLGQLQENMTAASKRVSELERWIALLVAIYIYLLACVAEGDGLFVHFPGLKLPAYLMSGAPSLYLFLRNRWRKFQIKHDWNSWLDNEFANGIWRSWNRRRDSH